MPLALLNNFEISISIIMTLLGFIIALLCFIFKTTVNKYDEKFKDQSKEYKDIFDAISGLGEKITDDRLTQEQEFLRKEDAEKTYVTKVQCKEYKE